MMAVERALAAVTLRQILARRRALGLAAFALLPAVVAAATRGRSAGADAALSSVLGLETQMVIPVTLPIVALVIATGVFGAEIDDGTALYVLAKPVARWRIVLTRVLVAAAATALLTAPAAFLVGPAAGGAAARGAAAAFAAAVVLGALLYSALFVALSLVTRRALLAGLAYVVLWEGTVARAAAGTRLLSVRQFVLTLADALTDAPHKAALGPRAATAMSVLIGVGAVLYAIRRLRRFEVGETG